MSDKELQTAHSELQSVMARPECHGCGCLVDTLRLLARTLPQMDDGQQALFAPLLGKIDASLPVQASCRGCRRCPPADAYQRLVQVYPHDASATTPSNGWPPLPGDYHILDPNAPVAICTLGDLELAGRLATAPLPGVAIVGPAKTENIGIERIVQNVIANPAIRALLLVGSDPEGHLPGQALLALAKNGIDEKGRIVRAAGRRPFVPNLEADTVRAFRQRITLVDRIGADDAAAIAEQVRQIAARYPIASACGCAPCRPPQPERHWASPPKAVRLDRAGYFVIFPLREEKVIRVEHYDYRDRLLRIIEGREARDIYRTIIDKGWVSDLGHAAYLGKELTRVQQAIASGAPYVQDGA